MIITVGRDVATEEQLALAEALYLWYKRCSRRYPASKERAMVHVDRDYELVRWMYAS